MKKKYKDYDVVVVGAGPAGMFACLKLLEGKKKLKIALVDMGYRLEKRKRSDVMSGFGGAGTYSDGKLHYTPKLSHERAFYLTDGEVGYQKILDQVEDTFKKFGVNSSFYPKNKKQVAEMIAEAQRHNIELIVRRAQHVGTDKLRGVIKKIESYMLKRIDFIEGVKIKDIIVEKGKCKGVLTDSREKIYSKKVLLAPGRVSAKWLQDIATKHGINYEYGMVEVGVRIEFPEAVLKRYADALYEIVLKIRTVTYDDIIRTFCSCPNGYVAVEDYHGYVCVNGHSDSKHESKNSNFAFVCEVHLTKPVENSIAYAQSIAKVASTIGGGKPILQRLADLRKGRRSTWSRLGKSIIKPSLTDVTPGDISMALPHRIVTNILEGLEKLDEVMPGVNSGSTLLYAPEVKFRSSRIVTDKGLQTEIENLHVAGDAAGISGSITGAAATGIIAGRGMIEALKEKR